MIKRTQRESDDVVKDGDTIILRHLGRMFGDLFSVVRGQTTIGAVIRLCLEAGPIRLDILSREEEGRVWKSYGCSA